MAWLMRLSDVGLRLVEETLDSNITNSRRSPNFGAKSRH